MSDNIYRQHESRPVLLSPHYAKHVSHMTTEDLYGKSEIAEELAVRDMEIERLRAENVSLQMEQRMRKLAEEGNAKLRAEVADLKASREAYNQECRDMAIEGAAYWKKIAEEREAELAAIKGQEPYRWLDWEGGSETFVTDSEASSYSPIGEKPFPLYALPVADKDAERPKLCLELTGAEIKDLAECAGFQIVPQDYSDECETEISLVECAATGVINDDGTAEYYRYVAYFSEYPEEGCHPLGPQIDAARAKGECGIAIRQAAERGE